MAAPRRIMVEMDIESNMVSTVLGSLRGRGGSRCDTRRRREMFKVR